MTGAPAQREASSYIDPGGFVAWVDGDVFRVVSEQRAAFYRRLLEDGTVDRLVRDFGYVSTEVADSPPAGLGPGLVLKHETINPRTYCVEWTPLMLRDAALQLLEISLAVVDGGYSLQDAYPWNTLFRGAEPVFVDFTSIVPADDRWIWPAYDQFEAHFGRPLALMSLGKGRVARLLLQNNIEGIGLDEFLRHVTPGYLLRRPWLVLVRWIDGYVQRSDAARQLLRRSLAGPGRKVTTAVRRRFLVGLKRKIEAISFPTGGDVWESYYETLPAGIDRDAKLNAVRGTVAELKPSHVVDLGANTGVFSVIAAEEGATVVAVDQSESCMDALYRIAKARRMPITPLIADVLCPTPSFGFSGREFPSLFDRVKGDLVLCLGLMHHLHIRGRQPFWRIADLLAAVAKRYVLFEYVDAQDPNNELIESARKSDYSFESVTSALGQRFELVKSMPSDRSTRLLLLLRKLEC